MIESGKPITELKPGTASSPQKGNIRVLANEAWLDSTAVDQLKKTAALPGIKFAVGLPDLHPGKGSPIGAAYASIDRIYPSLVGSDIGCGMALFGTDIAVNKIKVDKAVRKLGSIDDMWDGDSMAWLEARGLEPQALNSLGTIGGGNHFAELTALNTIYDSTMLERLNLDPKKLSLLVHSGSRSYGQAVLDEVSKHARESGMPYDSPEGLDYLKKHDYAVQWAKANRELIAERFLEKLDSNSDFILDLPHNFVIQAEIGGDNFWLHRKGAAPSDRGPVIIPGSRGALSYLVMPIGDLELSALSLAHGAGRKWSRGSCREKLEKRFDAKSLTRTELGGVVVCEDRDLIYQEAPQAYKDIGQVINDLQQNNLIHLISTFRPVLTYKVKAAGDDD